VRGAAAQADDVIKTSTYGALIAEATSDAAARLRYTSDMLQSTDDRRKVVELIEAMISADGVVTDEERQFLRRVVERFGLSADEREDRLVESDPGRATRTLRELPDEAKVRVMALLVDAAVVDGNVAPEEHALLLASAASLGIEACALEERIARRLKSNTPGV
jgi:uncharacterized tellurite resistance protein B-like protein